jgi:hypothetical protein
VQNEIFFLAQAVGLPIQRAPVDLFIAAIPLRADLNEPFTRQVHDVKTTGFRPEYYEAGLSNLNAKEASVPAQCRSRTGAADLAFKEWDQLLP